MRRAYSGPCFGPQCMSVLFECYPCQCYLNVIKWPLQVLLSFFPDSHLNGVGIRGTVATFVFELIRSRVPCWPSSMVASSAPGLRRMPARGKFRVPSSSDLSRESEHEKVSSCVVRIFGNPVNTVKHRFGSPNFWKRQPEFPNVSEDVDLSKTRPPPKIH